jgi:glycosyltransferase involved in cell wall biosynthesis
MPEKSGRVGVAVPVYNREQFLADALESVLGQTYEVADVVVVDDGSDDASAAIAEAIGPPVRVVRRPHAGIGATRTHAMSVVRGEFIVPLDSDDLLTPNSIESRIGMLRGRPEIDIVYGHIRRFARCAEGQPVALGEAQPAHVPNGMLVRRTAFERVGPFAAGFRVAECLDWMLRARARVGRSDSHRAGGVATRARQQQLGHELGLDARVSARAEGSARPAPSRARLNRWRPKPSSAIAM